MLDGMSKSCSCEVPGGVGEEEWIGSELGVCSGLAVVVSCNSGP